MAAKRTPQPPRKTISKITTTKGGTAVAHYASGAASWLGKTESDTAMPGVHTQLVALGRGSNGYDQFGYVPNAQPGQAGYQVSGSTPYAGAGMKTAGRVTANGWVPTKRSAGTQKLLDKAMGLKSAKHHKVGGSIVDDNGRTGGGTDESTLPVASSAQSQSQYAEGDLSRTGTAASQGKAYEALYGTDAGTVLHQEGSVPSIAQLAGLDTSTSTTTPSERRKRGNGPKGRGKGGSKGKGKAGPKGSSKGRPHARRK